MQQKKYDDAIGAFRSAEKLDPAAPDAHYRLARIYQTLGRTEESKKEFAKVVQLHQNEDADLAARMPAPAAVQTK